MPSVGDGVQGAQEAGSGTPRDLGETTADDNYSPEEAYELVLNLEDDMAQRLRAICWRRWPPDPDELWAVACYRIREGKRAVSRSKRLEWVLTGIVVSIAHEFWEKEKRKVELDAVADLPAQSSDPEEDLKVRDEREQMRRAVLALFVNDPRGIALVEAIFAAHEAGASLEGEELRKRAGLSEVEWPSVRRRVRRTINKAFPRGWSS